MYVTLVLILSDKSFFVSYDNQFENLPLLFT